MIQSDLAKYLAMCVRNAMEDFHCSHLSDDQMKELNPIVRNAIFTGLHHLRKATAGNTNSKDFVSWIMNMIPNYWEDPKLEEL